MEVLRLPKILQYILMGYLKYSREYFVWYSPRLAKSTRTHFYPSTRFLKLKPVFVIPISKNFVVLLPVNTGAIPEKSKHFMKAK